MRDIEIAGKKYHFKDVLGDGGTATVYLVTDDEGNECALKIAAYTDKLDFQRNLHNIAIIKDLNSPHIVDVIAMREEKDFGAYVVYSLLEYIEGQNLNEIMGKIPSGMDWKAAAKIVEQILSGVAALHENGMVHRDIKPANIMLDAEGVVKIIDFGYSKDINADRSQDLSKTPTGIFMGTKAFAPAQQTSSEANEKWDIYSVGAVMYFLLTGKNPIIEQQEEISIIYSSGIEHFSQEYANTLPADIITYVNKLTGIGEEQFASAEEASASLQTILKKMESPSPENVGVEKPFPARSASIVSCSIHVGA